MACTESARGGPGLFPKALRLAVVGALFLTALAVRLRYVADPPFDFQPTRQFRSALIARALYYRAAPPVPSWRGEVAAVSARRAGVLEAPVMECLAAAGYLCAGGERLWIPRAFAALCWIAGALFLYGAARDTFSPDAAVFAPAICLFLPFGILASTSFQPDSLMLALSLASIWAMVRQGETPSRRGWVLAASLSAAAVFVKPMALCWILGVHCALAVDRDGVRGAARRAGFWFFIPAVLSGAAAWGMLAGAFSPGGRILPHLLLTGFFWNGWRRMVAEAAGWPYVALALLGLCACAARRGTARALLAGMWGGYLAYCLAFTWHIPTHNYYHLPLIPIVALSAAGLASRAMGRMGGPRSPRFVRCCALGALILIAAHGLRRAPAAGGSTRDRREIEVSRRVGEMVGHSARTVMLASSYGFPLEYYGELAGAIWPYRFDMAFDSARGAPAQGAPERLRLIQADSPADYFVVTNLAELKAQPDLAEALARGYPLIASTPDCLIADLRGDAPRGGGAPHEEAPSARCRDRRRPGAGAAEAPPR